MKTFLGIFSLFGFLSATAAEDLPYPYEKGWEKCLDILPAQIKLQAELNGWRNGDHTPDHEQAVTNWYHQRVLLDDAAAVCSRHVDQAKLERWHLDRALIMLRDKGN